MAFLWIVDFDYWQRKVRFRGYVTFEESKILLVETLGMDGVE